MDSNDRNNEGRREAPVAEIEVRKCYEIEVRKCCEIEVRKCCEIEVGSVVR